jgi:hypothetical protein
MYHHQYHNTGLNPYFTALSKLHWHLFTTLSWNDDYMREWTFDAFNRRNKDIECVISKLRSILRIPPNHLGYFVKHEHNQAGAHVHLIITSSNRHVDTSRIVAEFRRLWIYGNHLIELFNNALNGLEYVCKTINHSDIPYDHCNRALLCMMKRPAPKAKRKDSRRYIKQKDGITYLRGLVRHNRGYRNGKRVWIPISESVTEISFNVDTTVDTTSKFKEFAADYVPEIDYGCQMVTYKDEYNALNAPCSYEKAP